MTRVVDRRNESDSGRYLSSRERLIKRHRKTIRDAVDQYLGNADVKDIGKEGIDVPIPQEDLFEPNIVHGQGGRNTGAHPGNRDFQQGDRIPKPPGGGGGGGSGDGDASADGEGEDEFVFRLSGDELKEILFEDLELPNLERKSHDSEETEQHRAGFVTDGSPNKMDLVRSKMNQKMRHKASGKPKDRKIIKKLEEQYTIYREYVADQDRYPDVNENETYQNFNTTEKLKAITDIVEGLAEDHYGVLNDDDKARVDLLNEQIDAIKRQKSLIPKWNETLDLIYRHHEEQPCPAEKAVMFCVMDVSGSMTQDMKADAKVFYWLLYEFLKEKYGEGKVDVVYIRHHTNAKEVDAEEFFYGQETGGTIVSHALQLEKEIMEERYPTQDYNIYTAQASDGDNWHDDNPKTMELINELLPKNQAYFYIETLTGRRGKQTDLWNDYERIQNANPAKFFMAKINERKDIFKVFREFFKPKHGSDAAPSTGGASGTSGARLDPSP